MTHHRRYYRSRPLTVEARQVHCADWDMCRSIAQWCGGDLVDIDAFLASHDLAVIFIPDADDPSSGVFAEDGDWIIRDQQGGFHVYDDQSFGANFDPVVTL